LQCDFGLSADDNFLTVVFASLESAYAFQYRPSSSTRDTINSTPTNGVKRVQAGAFSGPHYTCATVSCSIDGHITSLGQPTLCTSGPASPGETGKFIVWEAVRESTSSI